MSHPAHKIANDDTRDKEPHELPNNLEVEQGLLGHLLVNNAGIDRVADIIEPFHFYHPVHSRIYDAILKTVERGDIASPLRLKKYFENEAALEAVGGTGYLVDLAAAAFPFASPEDYPEKSSSDLTLLGDQIPKILGNLEAHRISEKAFLTSERLSFLFNASSNSDIVDHDCHYGNFLRDVNGIIHKIDISPLLAPRLYQEASLLLSAFLLKNPADISMLENFCSVWSISPKQQSELRVAMALRACAGIAYFDRIQKEMGYNPDAQIISQQYQHCFQAFNQV